MALSLEYINVPTFDEGGAKSGMASIVVAHIAYFYPNSATTTRIYLTGVDEAVIANEPYQTFRARFGAPSV